MPSIRRGRWSTGWRSWSTRGSRSGRRRWTPSPACWTPTARRPTCCTTSSGGTAGKRVTPKTLGQKRYVDAIRQNTVTFGIGPAGTGKTYLAIALAVAALSEREVARIILTRPAVEAGERLGFLPGDLQAKVDPYLRPLFDALHDMLDADRLASHMEKGMIEVAPLAFMRGRTLNDSFIILDEAQNTSPEQMQMFLTRLGFGSKVVVTGDITQIDLPRGQRSGPGQRHAGAAGRARHRLHQLRRRRRRPPQAGAADRQRLPAAHRRRWARSGPSDRGRRAGQPLAGALDEAGCGACWTRRWPRRGSTTGEVGVALVGRAGDGRAERDAPRQAGRDRRAVVPAGRPRRDPRRPAAPAGRRGHLPGQGRGGRHAGRGAASSTARCTCSAGTTRPTAARCSTARRRAARRWRACRRACVAARRRSARPAALGPFRAARHEAASLVTSFNYAFEGIIYVAPDAAEHARALRGRAGHPARGGRARA